MEYDLYVEKLDEVYVKVHCAEDSLAYDLTDYFKLRVKGYQFAPAFKKKRWDGYTRLFSKSTHKLYIGLLEYLHKFAYERELTIGYDDSLKIFQNIDPKQLADHINSFDLSDDKGQSIKPYWYQLDAVHHALSYGRSTLLAATSAGKSLMIYILCRFYLMMPQTRGKKILITVPTTSLVEQMYQDFGDYSQRNGWNHHQHCSKLYSGFDKYETNQILITTWQSIQDEPAEYFEQFGVFMGDECHGVRGEKLQYILKSCSNAIYRHGFTGTLDDSNTNKMIIEGLLGKVKRIVKAHELQAGGQSSEIEINALMLKHSDQKVNDLWYASGKQQKPKYADEMDFLCRDDQRNQFIVNLAGKLQGNTLVLFQFVEKHGKPLFNEISKIKDNVYFINGETEVEDRNEMRSILENNDGCTLVASYGTTSTGVNIKRINNIILASPYKSKIKVLQSIGRGLRKHKDKDKLRLYDLMDDLSLFDEANHTLDHGASRIELYYKECWDVNFVQIDL